ncbi:hypothetical protein KIL84_019839 [Mauremys mutica]|uniref:Uncharacterized protein n=1 Tax=Mauremys mutica TaxID=74926 RepID=A0A9D3XXP7_9SAUR|nr:hypothetical protein KIL84_019839 [Mauremys mutica]
MVDNLMNQDSLSSLTSLTTPHCEQIASHFAGKINQIMDGLSVVAEQNLEGIRATSCLLEFQLVLPEALEMLRELCPSVFGAVPFLAGELLGPLLVEIIGTTYSIERSIKQ